MLAAKCTSCHSDPPTDNSLCGLVTFADLVAPAKENPTMNEAEFSVLRMQSTVSPMPPAALLLPATASDIATLQNWINAGYPSGQCSPDAGVGGGPVDVFKGQPPYVAMPGDKAHNAGRDCLSCHGFGIAGTLYSAKGTAVANAEVRLVDGSGNAFSVYSGPNGNFYSGTTFTSGAHTGVRNAAGQAVMVGPITYGGCNKCHCTGGASCTTTRLHLP
jgi:hypothetical protein